MQLKLVKAANLCLQCIEEREREICSKPNKHERKKQTRKEARKEESKLENKLEAS